MVDFGNLISQPTSFQRPQKSTPPSGGALHLKRGVCVILIILESLKRPRRMQSEFCGLTQFGRQLCDGEVFGEAGRFTAL